MEHPIPQQISSYQFRLVGDMTLKQFFQVASGVVIALIIYSTGLPALIKWPLILVFFLLGIGMAFFPIQDRPLEKWIVLFANAIYSPTIYIWKHTVTEKVYFRSEEGFIPIPKQEGLRVISQAAASKGSAQTALTDNVSTPRLDKSEQDFLNKINQHMISAGQIQVVIPGETSQQRVITTQAKPLPPTPAQPQVQAMPDDISAPRPNITVYQSAPVKVLQEMQAQTQQGKQDSQGQTTQASTPTYETQKISPTVGMKSESTEHARFSNQASPPIAPTKPNVVVGQVIDSTGKIVENAIIEIKDSEGRAVRAIKSNKLGHFMIVTSLPNGMYELVIEKDNLHFKPIKFEAKGEIIRPIAIWAQK